MISREDFIFIIGFSGDVAIVDGRLKRQYGEYSPVALAEQGLYKAAISAAVYENLEEDLMRILEIFNRESGGHLDSVEELKTLFGTYDLPENVSKVKVV